MTHHRPFFSFSPSFSSDFLSPSFSVFLRHTPSYSVDKNINVQLPLSVDRETPETRSSAPTKFSRIFFLAKLATRPETARKKKSHRRCLLWCSFPRYALATRPDQKIFYPSVDKKRNKVLGNGDFGWWARHTTLLVSSL